MANPLDSRQFLKLTESIDWAQRQLDYPRKKRVESVRQFVGFHYFENGAPKRVPVNFLALAVQIYVRQLAARAPRAMITTWRQDLLPVAADLELAINQIPGEIGLTKTLRKFVTEALFSMGIVKCGLHTVGEALGHEYGEIFVDLVTLDDYFLDMAAQDYTRIDYEGNDYWIDYEELMDSGVVDKKDRAFLKPDEYTVIGPSGAERAEEISTDSSPSVYRDKIHLRDVWLPKDKLIVTYGVTSKRKIKVMDRDEPHGPYYRLGYTDVPSNLLPLAPAALWRDLHDLANSLYRKLGNQADSQKSVLGFSGENDEEVEEFKKARDGDGIRYQGREPKELKAGGIDAKTLAFYLQTKDLQSYFAGNIDSLGGLAAQTETVGQDRLIGEAAGAQLRDMADTTVGVIKEIFQAFVYYEWNDPIKRRMLEKPIPGTDLKVATEFGPEHKQGDMELYELSIDVYSMQDDSPQLKLQKLGLVTQQYVLPLAPLIQQQGGTIDVQRIMQLVAKYADLPELSQIVTFMEPPQVGQQGQGSGAPAQTERRYVREGRPGMTQRGSDREAAKLLLSSDNE